MDTCCRLDLRYQASNKIPGNFSFVRFCPMEILDNLSSTESLLTPIKVTSTQDLLSRGKRTYIQAYVEQQSQLAMQISQRATNNSEMKIEDQYPVQSNVVIEPSQHSQERPNKENKTAKKPKKDRSRKTKVEKSDKEPSFSTREKNKVTLFE